MVAAVCRGPLTWRGAFIVDQQYLKYARIGTFIWVSVAAIYFATNRCLFFRMFPHELGEFLAGWFAPLAALWVGAAVVLQRAQLVAQRKELDHAIEESRRSMEDLHRDASEARIERLIERLMFGIQRLARTTERCEIGRRDEVASVSEILGRHPTYVALAKGGEVARVLDECGGGIEALVGKIEDGWVMDSSDELLEDLFVELGSLDRICAEIGTACASGGSMSEGTAELQRFRACVQRGYQLIGAIRQEYDALGC